MLAKANSLAKNYEREIIGIDPNYRDDVKKKLSAEINDRYWNDAGPVRAELQAEVARLESELKTAQDPTIQLAKLAMQHQADATIADMSIISALPGLPDEMIAVLADQAKSPALQLALYGRVSGRSDETAATLRQTVLSRVAMPTKQIQDVALSAKKHLQALYDLTPIKGDHSHAKLDYAHQMATLDKILAG
ncbi:hypothetical protein [uncultured Desulfobacter sp.]|uniref:hypothetical protein n=1 Tax=uncultured Desulfobacter sp. TaxID=240139 RepID=UPI002AA79C5A|nr:hypothetical protein [uncultured Desulfobacter sp.]